MQHILRVKVLENFENTMVNIYKDLKMRNKKKQIFGWLIKKEHDPRKIPKNRSSLIMSHNL